jgi:uncharacterized protein YjbI with pentapeptide repeats
VLRRLIDSPFALMLAAVAAGGGGVLALVLHVSQQCSNAYAAAKGFRGFDSWIATALCDELVRDPPWLQLFSLAAVPSVLLTWYWKERKRRDDQTNANMSQRVAQETLQHSIDSALALRAKEQAAATLAQESAIAERYTAAAALIGSKSEMTRITGLFALWDVARESPQHRSTVAMTFAAFLRSPDPQRPRLCPSSDGENAPDQEVMPLPPDALTAATLVGDRIWGDAWRVDGKRIRISLADAALAGCRFQRADLRDAQFDQADLRRADFTNGDLREARLHKVNLDGAWLIGVKADDSDFGYSSMRGAHCYGIQLQRAHLASVAAHEANFMDAECSDAKMTLGVFDRAEFRNATLDRCDLRFVSFVEANLVDATLCRANLQGAKLNRAKLMRANLRGADLTGARLDGADLEGANLERTQLHGVSMVGANVTDVKLDDGVILGPVL